MNATGNTYYQSAISAIQAVGPNIHPSGPKDIYDELFDNNEDLHSGFLLILCSGGTCVVRYEYNALLYKA